MHQRFWHEQQGGHCICLTFAQIQAIPKLLKAIVSLLVIVPVKAGGIMQGVRSVYQNMADFVCQNEPPTAIFGWLLQKGIQNNRIFGIDNADTLVIPFYIQRV